MKLSSNYFNIPGRSRVLICFILFHDKILEKIWACLEMFHYKLAKGRINSLLNNCLHRKTQNDQLIFFEDKPNKSILQFDHPKVT